MACFGFSLRRAAARRVGGIGGDAHTSDGRQGPGWFDSSWDLANGLDVLEGMPSDAPLDVWLELSLGDVPAASVAVPQRDEQPGARLVPATANGALGDAVQFGDLRLAVAAEVAHLDQFGQFGIDGLELV